jgi:hypothetical protein
VNGLLRPGIENDKAQALGTRGGVLDKPERERLVLDIPLVRQLGIHGHEPALAVNADPVSGVECRELLPRAI